MAKTQEKELVTEQSKSVATQEKPKEEFTEPETLFIITLMNKGKTMAEAKEACIKHRSLKPKNKIADAASLITQKERRKESVLRDLAEKKMIDDANAKEVARQNKAYEEAKLEKNKSELEVNPNIKVLASAKK